MPKRSRTDDRKLAMISSHAPPQPQQKPKTKTSQVKSSETAGKRKGNPLDIPLKDFSPEVREMLVAGLVKGGRARLITRKQSKESKEKK